MKYLKKLFLLGVMFPSVFLAALMTEPPPIPELSKWEQNMTKFGAKHMKPIPSELSEKYVWHYDGIKVFYQIAAYTRDEKWKEGVKVCKDFYREKYILANNGKIGGWRVFPHGLYLDYKLTGDEISKKAIILIAKNAAFADRTQDYSKTKYDLRKIALSREVAYSINCYQTAKELGEAGFQKEDPYLDIALGHLDLWLAWLKENPGEPYPYMQGEVGFQPFMVGLTCEALIRYYESKDADPKKKKLILEKIKETAKYMFKEAWIPEKRAFYYESAKREPAPDANLLICPAYGWLWHRTGDKSFLDMGDKLFSGGVNGAWLDGGKQFSQNYRWSFDYVKWRSVEPEVEGDR